MFAYKKQSFKETAVRKIREINLFFKNDRADIYHNMLKVDKMNRKALRRYQLQTLDICIDLFRANNLPDFDYLGWKPFATGGIRIHEMPGEHNKIFDPPDDKVLADLLQQCLDRNEITGKYTLSKKDEPHLELV
jgi:thioesterase domain-containing protein